jgi:type IV secretion system protein VirB4
MDLLSLLLGAGGGALLTKALSATREFRPGVAGIADLLHWDSVLGEGVLQQADGSMLCAWAYRGADMQTATIHERNALARQLNEALLPLSDGWMFHVDALRRPARFSEEEGAFPDGLSRLIDEERRLGYPTRFEPTPRTEEGARAECISQPKTRNGARSQESRATGFYETHYVLTATYKPPAGVYNQLSRFFVTGRERAATKMDRFLDLFEAQVAEVEMRLGGPLRLRRLPTEALLRHLHTCLTGLRHPVAPPPVNVGLGTYLADQQVFGGFAPRVGDRHVRAVSLHGFPNATSQGVLDRLHNLPAAYRWSTRLIMLSAETASQLIRTRRHSWFKKRKGLSEALRSFTGQQVSEEQRRIEREFFEDESAVRMATDAKEALTRMQSAQARYCLYTSTFIVMETEEACAEEIAEEIREVLVEAGFPSRIEDVNALEAYLGSLPGNGTANSRRFAVHTRNVADLMPATQIWPGAEHNQSHLFPPKAPALLSAKTDGSTPFRLNLHAQGDVGHTLVIGATGAGKSVLVNTLMAQWLRYEKAQVFLFDLGHSGYLLAKGVGGRHYQLSPDAGAALSLQPLLQVDNEEERAWAASWIETTIELQGVTPTPARRAEIARALQLIAANPPRMRTLEELKILVQDEAVAGALGQFVGEGTYAHLLNGSRDALAGDVSATKKGEKETSEKETCEKAECESGFGPSGVVNPAYQVFELSAVRDLPESVFIPLLLYLFHHVERQLRADRPSVIVLEEVWHALMHSSFSERIKQWLLTLRKRNAAVVMVAHTPAQIAQLENREIVIDSCPTKIFLPNPDAVDPEAKILYRTMGLNEREIEAIATATRKKHYFFKCPVGSRLFDLDLGPLALQFVAMPTGDVGALRQRVERLENEHGRRWVAHWLREQGLPGWAERFADLERTPFTDTAEAGLSGAGGEEGR